MCCPCILSVAELGKILKFMALSHKTKKLCGMADIYVENIGETN